jgi:hypothetical protein
VSGTPKSSFSVLRDPATDPVDAQGSILWNSFSAEKFLNIVILIWQIEFHPKN